MRVYQQVKATDLVPEFLRQNFSYRYCEATCLPRTFWINMSDNYSSNTMDLPVSVTSKTESTWTKPVSITNLPCFHDFSCFLLFSESMNRLTVNQADSLQSRPSSPKSRPSSAKVSESRPSSSSLKIRNAKSLHSLVR